MSILHFEEALIGREKARAREEIYLNQGIGKKGFLTFVRKWPGSSMDRTKRFSKR